jgi:hypothetical protein
MKRLIALGLVIALVLTLALPVAVSAADGGSVVSGHVLGTPVVSAVYNTTTTTAAYALPVSNTDTPSVTVDIIGSSFDATDGISPHDPFPVVTTTAGTVTVLSSTSSKIIATIVLTAGTISGNYDVIVAQGGRTSAQTSADHFLVKSYGNVSAPSTISLGLMSTGTPTTANSTGTISTNDTTWSMTVNNTNTTNAGYMSTGGNGTGSVLADPFMISKDSTLGDFVASNTGLSAGTTYPSTGSSLPLYVSQKVESGDAAGGYSITITFTWSAKY